MSFSTLVFLTIRAVHVLLAATWLGSVGFMVFFVLPALKETGSGGAPMMGAFTRRGLNGFMGALGGVTVLTGFYLYWRFTGGFDPALSATRAAMVFGTGGIAGLISVILGGALVGRSMKKMAELAAKGLMTESAAARDRGIAGARIVLVLQVIALICMAVGHYV